MITDNVVKVDLRKGDDYIRDISYKMGIIPDSLINDKENFDVLFFMLVDGKFYNFAYIRKGEKGINFMKSYYRELSKLETSNSDDIVREPKEPEVIEYDIDSILEKISEKGIESLTKAEKDFLDNSSK